MSHTNTSALGLSGAIPKNIRVRFAPSPTGEIHLGNLRAAVFNDLFVRHFDGTFILRIDDTDAARNELRFEESILDGLRWLGIAWSEGPDIGGPYGPYRQSEKTGRYREAAERLLAEGHAYRCFCSTEELESMRKEASRAHRPPIYPRRCASLTSAEIERRIEAGEPSVIRFRMPDKEVIINDIVRGDLNFPARAIEDLIILRSDGTPSYNLATVIDDIDMKIDLVIRGEDHLPNTPKQVAIAEALGADPARFLHLPLILGSDGAKLSKRNHDSSIAHFVDDGFLPEAVYNYLASLGYTIPDREVAPPAEIARSFDPSRISTSPAAFDIHKLTWFNGEHQKKLSLENFEKYFRHFSIHKKVAIANFDVIKILQQNSKTLLGSLDLLSIFDQSLFRPHDEALNDMRTDPNVAKIAEELVALTADSDAPLVYSDLIACLTDRIGIKGKALFHALRIVVTGRFDGPKLAEIFPHLGARIIRERALQALALASDRT